MKTEGVKLKCSSTTKSPATIYFVCVCVCVCAPPECLVRGTQEEVLGPWNWGYGCPLGGCWELNPSLLQEQQVL